MTNLAKSLAATALLGAFGAIAIGHQAMAADQRYVIEACGGPEPCVFVLDTESGEIRYCDTAECRVLDAVEAAERPSPFPLAGQGPVADQRLQPGPLTDLEAVQPIMPDRPASPPTGDGGPAPFPFVEPAPLSQ